MRYTVGKVSTCGHASAGGFSCIKKNAISRTKNRAGFPTFRDFLRLVLVQFPRETQNVKNAKIECGFSGFSQGIPRGYKKVALYFLEEKTVLYAPLELTNKIKDIFPGAYAAADKKLDGSPGFSYDVYSKTIMGFDGAFLKFLPALSPFENRPLEGGTPQFTASVVSLLSCHQWRKHKQVYSFTDELTEILIDQALHFDDVPSDVLAAAPYSSFYVKAPILSWFDGFFFTKGKEQLFLLYVNPDCTGVFPLIIPTVDLKTGDQLTTVSAMFDQYGIFGSDENETIFIRNIETMCCIALQMVLYICAQNADIRENENQAARHRPATPGFIKDKVREVKAYDVGETVAVKVRQARLGTTRTAGTGQAASGQGSRKTPHSRRGHWSHYWTGKGRKKCVLKWIAPLFINGGGETVKIDVISQNKKNPKS